jgi:hypothetical protein
MKNAKEGLPKPTIETDLGIDTSEEITGGIEDISEPVEAKPAEAKPAEAKLVENETKTVMTISTVETVMTVPAVIVQEKEETVSLPSDFSDDPDVTDEPTPVVVTPSVVVSSPVVSAQSSDLPTGEITWITQSPAAMYDAFYGHKVNVIKHCCTVGNYITQIPFSKYKKELEESRVDTSVVTFDPKEIYIKMAKIQDLRTRATQIQVDVAYQYFRWKRSIELLRGVLARTDAMKPVNKQDGLNYEHLSDAEMYFNLVESLHWIAEKIVKNLDSNYEMLSRQVSIVMPQKPIERYAQPSSKSESLKKIPEEMKDFDELGDNIIVEKEANTSKGVKPFDLGE